MAYSRKSLAMHWGYSSYQALARGVVTPKDDNKIILFVTEVKQPEAEQYNDRLKGNILEWEGPTDHFAETRMINAISSDDEIHLFHRQKHHTDFIYIGQMTVIKSALKKHSPSQFTFKVL